MAEVRPDEVSAILRQQLSGFKSETELEEVGTVLQIGDGIARIYGLTKVQAGELVEFETGLKAMVLNLEEDNVGAVLFGASEGIKEGDTVRRTGKIASLKVGEGMIGRVVNPLGEPIDGKGPMGGDFYDAPYERKAPGVIFRKPVTEPLQTGLKPIDAMTARLARPPWRSTPSSTKKNSTTRASPSFASTSPVAKKAPPSCRS
jgi:F-type H+-transporting ATPase subunit alpha